MELKNLLDKQSWSESEFDYSTEHINDLLRPRAESTIQKLFRYHKQYIILNSVLTLASMALFFVEPRAEMLIPLGLIGGTMVFIILSMVYQMSKIKKPDLDQDLRQVLKETVEYNKMIFKSQYDYFPILMTTSFAGGFFLSTILSGWDFERFANEPIRLIVFGILTVGFYFLSKTRRFRRFNRSMNPRYNKIKNALEEQLAYLESGSENND